MPELKTDKSLLNALERASSRPLTREQMERQRVSFVMGSLSTRSDLTREQVRDALNKQGAYVDAAE